MLLVLTKLLILHWNTTHLIVIGGYFKWFIYSQKERSDLICVQESRLTPCLNLIMSGYVAMRRDREGGVGGGCGKAGYHKLL